MESWADVDIPPVGSKPTHQKQNDDDDQDDADDADSAMTEAVAVAAETATEAPEQVIGQFVRRQSY